MMMFMKLIETAVVLLINRHIIKNILIYIIKSKHLAYHFI